jgi:hypothetical protein
MRPTVIIAVALMLATPAGGVEVRLSCEGFTYYPFFDLKNLNERTAWHNEPLVVDTENAEMSWHEWRMPLEPASRTARFGVSLHFPAQDHTSPVISTA